MSSEPSPPPPPPVLTTITPNNIAPVATERYVRLLIVTTTLLLLLLALYLAVKGLALIHHTVLLFSLGGLFAYALDPIVEVVRGNVSLRGRRLTRGRLRPRWLGVLAVFAVLIGALALGTFLVGQAAIRQGQELARDRDRILANGRAKIAEADDYLRAHGIPANLSDTVEHPPENVRKWGEAVAKSSFSVASGISHFLVEGIIVLLISVYFLIFSEELRETTGKIFPERIRPYVSQWQDDVNRILGGFVRGQATLALVMGAAAGIACLWLGLRFWLLIGVFVVVASLIPVVGPYIGLIPALLSAVLTPAGFLGPGLRAALVVILFAGINEAGSKILYPRLVGKALGLHEVLVLFVLLAGFEVGGIIGVLFAAPLTALALVTLTQIYRMWLGEPPVSVANEAAVGGEEAKAEGTP